MKITVIGNGQLGTEFNNLLCQLNIHNSIISHSQLDISNIIKTREVLLSEKPDFVINCSAYNKVDMAEIFKDEAFKANAIGPKNLAILSNALNYQLIHFSTDFVFDGYKKEKYIETDDTNPLSYYGYSKLWGEKFVQQFSNNYMIFRVSWLYGNGRQNLIHKLIDVSKKDKRIYLPNNIYGIPTSCVDVTNQVIDMIYHGYTGLYHSVSSGNPISVFEYGKTIKNLFKLPINILQKNSNDRIRPKNAVLENFMLNLENINLMPEWDKSLRQFAMENNVP